MATPGRGEGGGSEGEEVTGEGERGERRVRGKRQERWSERRGAEVLREGEVGEGGRLGGG